MADNLNITHDLSETTQIISAGILPNLQKTLEKDAMNDYAQQTEEEKRKELEMYKKKFAEWKDRLEGTTNIDTYLQAYEFILQFRQFILGNAGIINYTFSMRASDRGSDGAIYMKTLTIGSADFLKLIKDEEGHVIGLSQSGDNLRFNSAFLKNLRALIKNIETHDMSIEVDAGCSSFILVNENLGTKQNFSNGRLFKSKIQFLQRQKKAQNWYTFILKGSKDESNTEEAKVFKFDVDHVEGSPQSSSLFSAIGKYFADEMTAKKNLANQLQLNVDPSYPNAGNLTELYILAKQRLNNGKNTFRPNPMPVPGQTLFELYKEVKSNTEPFYSGGDVLLEQIKSFLGSNPSLTSYKTIRNTIANFYNALNTSNIEETKQELSKLLLQQGSNQVSQEQKNLSLAIAKSFTQFFANLTK